MRIKSLELQGFKSFPDKTTVNFDSGVTIIVGPNGSGKSNISDAIRWVLGEISSKNIRGNKMEDVIFGGTDTRRQMGFAEVSLTIDNTDPANRMNIEYDEVTVTRRYYRTGESEYYINAKAVRLKDIAELFMNTGIGRTGYSVIGQGRIAEIISQKSEDRRIIFEEAAGISKYRYKKKESERKLAETNDNLVRVTDILSELEGRVKPLEKEAEKARAYLDMYDEKKRADVSLWLYDIGMIRADYARTDAAYIVASKELEIIDDEIKALETQNDALYLETQNAKKERESIENRAKELSEQYHSLESSGKVLENDIAHLEAQIVRYTAELDSAAEQLASLADTRTQNTENLTAQKDKLAALDANLRAQGEVLDKLRADIFDLHTKRCDLEKAEREAGDALIEMRATLASLKQTEEHNDTQKLDSERAAREEQIALLTARIEQARTTIAEYQQKIDEIESGSSIKAEIDECQSALNDLNAQKEKTTLRIDVLEQRHQTLQRMAEHFEGYAYSVKFIMERAASGALSGVYGTISDIIETDSRYALAIETALGNHIQNIVVDNEATTKKAINLLKENRAGKATFFPVSAVTAPPLNVDTVTIEASEGFIGYADALVKNDVRYDEIVKNLLGRTVVFETLDHAITMEKKIGYKIKCVTLDGQIINTGGSFTGGSAKRDSGILSRSAEMDEIKKEISKRRTVLSDIEKQIEECNERRKDLNERFEEADRTVSLLRTLQNAEDTQMQVLGAQLENEHAGVAHIAAELEEYQNSINARAEQARALEQSMNQKQAALSDLSAQLADAKTACDNAEQELARAVEQKNSLLVQIASAEKDVDAAQKELDNTDAQICAGKEEHGRISAQLTLLRKTLLEKRSKIKENEQVQSASGGEIETLSKRSEELRAVIAELEEKNNALRTRFMSRTHDRELKFRESSNLEHKRAQIHAKQEAMSARIWDEYELSYTAAIDLDYPPVTEQNRAEVAALTQEFRNKMRSLGNVNVGAIEEYAAVKERYDFLSGQVNDLNASRDDLTGIIHRLESEMRTKFAQSFDEINTHFKLVFRELFGGGSANLTLTDQENILESGIEIDVAPPGKIIKNLQLLSGGEQVFVAIALYFAILKVNPTPFCLLDEIEAALDEVNVTKFADYAKKYSGKTQFIIITHRRGTMEAADTLYGVTMQERGISKILSVNVNEAEKRLGVKLA